MNVEDAVQRLKDGNAKHAEGSHEHPNVSAARLREVAHGQAPFACILTCSDSRVVPEFIFDAGVGDIFSIENAGNIVDDHVLGSIQYAVEALKVPVVMVLGHSRCGAIGATMKGVRPSGKLGCVFDSLEPAVDACTGSTAERYSCAIIENVKRGISRIRKEIPSIGELEDRGELLLTGAIYRIEDGTVEFLPGQFS